MQNPSNASIPILKYIRTSLHLHAFYSDEQEKGRPPRLPNRAPMAIWLLTHWSFIEHLPDLITTTWSSDLCF